MTKKMIFLPNVTKHGFVNLPCPHLQLHHQVPRRAAAPPDQLVPPHHWHRPPPVLHQRVAAWHHPLFQPLLPPPPRPTLPPHLPLVLTQRTVALLQIMITGSGDPNVLLPNEAPGPPRTSMILQLLNADQIDGFGKRRTIAVLMGKAAGSRLPSHQL